MQNSDDRPLATAKPLPGAVRLVVSGLTDTRYLQQRLQTAGVVVKCEQVSMASGQQRDYFRALQQRYDWHGLPMVFVADDDKDGPGEFVGGELEMLQWLADDQ